MQGKIYLDTRANQKRKDGSYPLICVLTGNSKQIPFSLKMKFLTEEWNFDKQEPKKDKSKLLIIRRKKSLLDDLLLKSLDDGKINIEYIKNVLTGKLEEQTDCESKGKNIDFFKFGYDLAMEKRQILSSKGILKEGSAENYETALNQLRKFNRDLSIASIDYKLLTEFKNAKLKRGNKKSTVSTYLKDLRAIYNECLRRYKLRYDHNPFEGVFSGITVKKNRTKKRNISIESVKILESFDENLVQGQQLAVDLFLLQFYFGGQDLIDIYYLEKKQVSKNGRVYFIRGKLDDGGYEFDLKIFDKSSFIFKKFISRDRFVINGRKDHVGYKNFRNRVNKNLKLVQERYNEHVSAFESIDNKEYCKLELLPLGGSITTKVARHTFSTIGNRMYIEPDLLRALMGHERDDVDTIYKDVYPANERDKYHEQIIDTSSLKTKTKFVYQLEYFNSEHQRSWKYRYFDKEPVANQLIDESTLKEYSQPKNFKRIYLIEK